MVEILSIRRKKTGEITNNVEEVHASKTVSATFQYESVQHGILKQFRIIFSTRYASTS
jgi:hypothetical protein